MDHQQLKAAAFQYYFSGVRLRTERLYRCIQHCICPQSGRRGSQGQRSGSGDILRADVSGHHDCSDRHTDPCPQFCIQGIRKAGNVDEGQAVFTDAGEELFRYHGIPFRRAVEPPDQ